MTRRGKLITAAALLWYFTGLTGDARADPYTILPNGDLVFNTALTTQGVFTCLAPIPCSGSGTNSVTLGSGANTGTLTFTGVDTRIQVGNVALPVSLGTVELSAPSGFTFPAQSNPNVSVLQFDFSITHTSPVPGTASQRWFYGPGGNPTLPLLLGSSWTAFSTGPNPPGYHYTFLVYSFGSRTLPGQIGADVGAAPEPATLVLLGTGLAVGAVRARRRRREH